MYRQKGIGKSEAEARERALEALKERLWRECWKGEIELPVRRERVVEKDGIFEIEIETW